MVRKLKWDLELWADNPMGGHLWRRATCIPKVYWHRVSVLRLICVMVMVLQLAVNLFGHQSGYHYAPLCASMVLLVWALIYTVLPRVVFSRLKRHLLTNDCLVCLSCGYLLHGLPEEHICPECGTSYRIDELRRSWQHWLVHRRLPEHAPPT